MKSYANQFCDDGNNTLQNFPETGILRCAEKCNTHTQCVAYNFRVSTGCTLRQYMCAQENIMTEEGAVYRGTLFD